MNKIFENTPAALDRRRLLRRLGLVGLGMMSGAGSGSGAARAQSNQTTKPGAKVPVSPPPADVNDLSMEVAAMRTLYLLHAGPDQTDASRPHGYYSGIKGTGKDAAQKARQRQKADVSKNYLKVLTELRAAFITGQKNRINELSD